MTATGCNAGGPGTSSVDHFFFDRPALLAFGHERHEEFAAARPFPHVVIDDLLPADVVSALLAEFPGVDDPCWRRREEANERKLGLSDDTAMGPATRQVLAQFNSAPFLDFLSALTGIPGLIVDPHFLGGGLHQIQRGGLLKVHKDFNVHRELGLLRQLNALLYLNTDWNADYGGQLELWDETTGQCLRRVEPLCNRMVVFATPNGAHGHPDPLNCPEGRTRRSMALYYYTSPAGRDLTEAHTTVWLGNERSAAQTRARRLAHEFLPPVLHRALRGSRGRARATP